MPASRIPGPLGLMSDEGRPTGPFEAWPLRPAVPTGAAADAHYETGPVALESPSPWPVDHEDSQATPEIPKPIERYRYMEIQGEVFKVRCIPLWQGRVLAMLAGSDEDDKALESLVRTVRHHKPHTRAQMVQVIMNQLRAEGREGGATAGRIARIKLPSEEGAGDGAFDGGLPAVQSGGRVSNG